MMKIKQLFLVVLFCVGLLACKKESESGSESGNEIGPDESGYYLVFKRQGRSDVWNQGGQNANHYGFNAYFNSRRADLFLNVSAGIVENNNPFKFSINIRNDKLDGSYTILPDGRNGNAFSFLYGRKFYNLAGERSSLKVSITTIDSVPEIVKGTFSGILTETIPGDNGRIDSALVPVEGSFRLRLVDLTESSDRQNL